MKRLAVGLAIFLLTLAVRLLEYFRVFTPGGVFPPNGADEYYHLRRIWYSVVNFPKVLEFDSYMAYPAGGEVMWPPGFDLAIAAVARLFVGSEDQASVEIIAAWVPPILGGLTAVAAAALGARLFTPAAGVVAGLGLAMLPGHYFYSLLGMVDHHSAVSLIGALMVLGAVRVIQREEGAEWVGGATALGLGAAAYLFVWPGALLDIALLQGLASLWMLQARSGEMAIFRGRRLAVAHGLAALALAPYALGREWIQFGGWSPLVLSSFQPVWFAANAIACLFLANVWAAIPPLGERAISRWASALGLAAAALAAVFVAIPDLAASLDLAAGWFRGDEEFLSGIVEMLPLFADIGGQWWGQRAERLLTRFIFIHPVLLLWVLVRALRSGRADLLLLTVWSGVGYAQVLAQTRFVNSFSVSFVILLAGAGVALAAALKTRLSGSSRGLQAAVAVAAVGAIAFGVQPAVTYMANIARALEVGPLTTVRSSYREALVYRGVAEWIAANTPPTGGYLNESEVAEYGVLARWDRGHLLRYESERPVVQDNFGLYGGRKQFDAAGKYFLSEREGEAVAILEELGVRYIVTDGIGAAVRARYSERSMARRLYPYPRGENADGRTPLPLRLSGFRHHRLLLESQPGRLDVPFLRVFERVAGAAIEGQATPHSVVRATLEVTSPSRPEPGSYGVSIRTGDDGRYALRVAYSTASSHGVETADRYWVSCGPEKDPVASEAVAVPEEAVIEGKGIAGPTLACE